MAASSLTARCSVRVRPDARRSIAVRELLVVQVAVLAELGDGVVGGFRISPLFFEQSFAQFGDGAGFGGEQFDGALQRARAA